MFNAIIMFNAITMFNAIIVFSAIIMFNAIINTKYTATLNSRRSSANNAMFSLKKACNTPKHVGEI